MTKEEQLEGLTEELHNKMSDLSSIKLDPEKMSEKEMEQTREILSTMSDYMKRGDKIGLQKFLIHTKNELSNSHR